MKVSMPSNCEIYKNLIERANSGESLSSPELNSLRFHLAVCDKHEITQAGKKIIEAEIDERDLRDLLSSKQERRS